jgi:divalent metal cation (Fe/Co/Zn/Cd) transporter
LKPTVLLQADAWHHRSDTITSMLLLIGISIALFRNGYEAADDWAALFASAFIITVIKFSDPL